MPTDVPVLTPQAPRTAQTYRFASATLEIRNIEILDTGGQHLGFARVRIEHLGGDRFNIQLHGAGVEPLNSDMDLSAAQKTWLLDVAQTAFRTAGGIA